uniref:Odorant receptor n=1 Tax=Panagrellus redivivus TaxID=6233 RepID=A0A7E4VUX6_PANRE
MSLLKSTTPTKRPKSLPSRLWHSFNKWGWTDHTTSDVIADEASHYRRIKTMLAISGVYHERECYTDFGRLIFLLYWQRNNALGILLKGLPWPTTSPADAPIRRMINCVFVMYIVHALGAITLTAYAFMTRIEDVSYYLESRLLTSVGGLYSHLILVKTIVLHVVTSVNVYHAILKVNADLKNLKKTNSQNSIEFNEKFQELYNTHNNLAEMVRTLDRFFQAYTFVLIALNIPVLVFTALDLMDNIESGAQTAIGIPLIAFCCIELTALTAMPAKMHVAMHNTASMILENPSIWFPYDESVYQIANVFVSHVRETNLGITLWGFAVVNKPTIMATVSVALTFFTFVVQAKWHENELHERFANLTNAASSSTMAVVLI